MELLSTERRKELIKIGLLGLGTVGSGVYSIINKHSKNIEKKVGTKLKVEKILVNDRLKERDLDFNKELLTENVLDILEDPDIDMVVELIGGEEPSYHYIIEALKKGKSVVTANKLVIARHGNEVLRLARKKGVQIGYEGSVAGGIPVIRPLKESLAANRIERIYGILNGTTNYILTKMHQEDKEFNEVLKKAQELGYAENDPSSDIEGLDAVYKISILATIAFESFINVDSVYCEGIEKIRPEDIKIAEELGYVIKLLAIARRIDDELDIRVHPALISKSHPLALVNDVYNAIYIYGDAVGDVVSYGKGAGKLPTGSAVVADIIQVAKDIKHNKYDFTEPFQDVKVKKIDDIENAFYLNLQVQDKPGVLASITKVLGDNGVSLASVLQKHRLSPIVPLVLITHPVKERNMKNSLKEMEGIEEVLSINSVIRVEEEMI